MQYLLAFEHFIGPTSNIMLDRFVEVKFSSFPQLSNSNHREWLTDAGNSHHARRLTFHQVFEVRYTISCIKYNPT